MYVTRGPWALSLCLWYLTTYPDIQLSLMLNGHVAKVKYFVSQVKVHLYSSLSLYDKKLQNDLDL